jgi:hypothetical protein
VNEVIKVELEVNPKPRKIRIVTGTHLEVERQVNELADDYAVNAWSLWSHEGEARVTAVLLHGSIYRQAAIAATSAPGNGRR